MSPNSNRPRSIKQLNRLAKVHTDDCIPIEIYISSAKLLLKQARIYYREENEEQAYIYYLKYINLVLNELGQRSGFDQLKNKDMIQTCIEALDALEVLRPSLEAVYESYELYHSSSTNLTNTSTSAAANEINPNEEIASSQKIQVTDDDIHPPTVAEEAIRDLETVPMDWEYTPSAPPAPLYHHQPNHNLHNNIAPTHIQQNHYLDTHRLYKKQDQQLPAPPLPPKIKLIKKNNDLPPPLPPKIQLFLNKEQQDISLDDNNSFFGSSDGNNLRILNVPKGIQESFLSIARFNTSNNVETCGILSGKLQNNELYLTSLLIPNQEGTSDTCITKDEETIFEYQDKNGLITLGWIHTHPSQTCFLSSVDLHTHCSYQLMLPEAIAIVCAPNHNPDFGIFRLTSPDGLKEITNCRIPESFHPHSEEPALYEDSYGHVRLNVHDTLEIIDLRC